MKAEPQTGEFRVEINLKKGRYGLTLYAEPRPPEPIAVPINVVSLPPRSASEDVGGTDSAEENRQEETSPGQ